MNAQPLSGKLVAQQARNIPKLPKRRLYAVRIEISHEWSEHMSDIEGKPVRYQRRSEKRRSFKTETFRIHGRSPRRFVFLSALALCPCGKGDLRNIVSFVIPNDLRMKVRIRG